MFGKPEDTEGECNAHLYLCDDCGDNETTIRCQLPKGHKGTHCEWFYRGEGKVTIAWEKDERAEREKLRKLEEVGCLEDL